MAQGTRGDFFQSIDSIDQNRYPETLTMFFEQFSILYNIIGGYENLQVSKNNDQFSFSIHTPSPEIANEIICRASGEVVQIYDKTFSINIEQLGPMDLIIFIR